MKLTCLGFLALAACGRLGPAAPSPGRIIPQPRVKATCLVSVATIPEPPGGGHGWTWVQASTSGGGCGSGPTWTIKPEGADVFPWHEDPLIAYIGGEEGTYQVTATFVGGFGSANVTITH